MGAATLAAEGSAQWGRARTSAAVSQRSSPSHDHADFVLQRPAERCSVGTRDARRAELLLRRWQWNRISRLCKRNSPTAPP